VPGAPAIPVRPISGHEISSDRKLSLKGFCFQQSIAQLSNR
jgi:hypothetical protein